MDVSSPAHKNCAFFKSRICGKSLSPDMPKLDGEGTAYSNLARNFGSGEEGIEYPTQAKTPTLEANSMP